MIYDKRKQTWWYDDMKWCVCDGSLTYDMKWWYDGKICDKTSVKWLYDRKWWYDDMLYRMMMWWYDKKKYVWDDDMIYEMIIFYMKWRYDILQKKMCKRSWYDTSRMKWWYDIGNDDDIYEMISMYISKMCLKKTMWYLVPKNAENAKLTW